MFLRLQIFHSALMCERDLELRRIPLVGFDRPALTILRVQSSLGGGGFLHPVDNFWAPPWYFAGLNLAVSPA